MNVNRCWIYALLPKYISCHCYYLSFTVSPLFLYVLPTFAFWMCLLSVVLNETNIFLIQLLCLDASSLVNWYALSSIACGQNLKTHFFIFWSCRECFLVSASSYFLGCSMYLCTLVTLGLTSYLTYKEGSTKLFGRRPTLSHDWGNIPISLRMCSIYHGSLHCFMLEFIRLSSLWELIDDKELF